MQFDTIIIFSVQATVQLYGSLVNGILYQQLQWYVCDNIII